MALSLNQASARLESVECLKRLLLSLLKHVFHSVVAYGLLCVVDDDEQPPRNTNKCFEFADSYFFILDSKLGYSAFEI